MMKKTWKKCPNFFFWKEQKTAMGAGSPFAFPSCLRPLIDSSLEDRVSTEDFSFHLFQNWGPRATVGRVA